MIQTQLKRPSILSILTGRDYHISMRDSKREREMILIVRATSGQVAAKKAVQCVSDAGMEQLYVNMITIITK